MAKTTTLLKCEKCRTSRKQLHERILKRRKQPKGLCHFCGNKLEKQTLPKVVDKNKNVAYVSCKICKERIQRTSLTRHMWRHDKSSLKKCFICQQKLSSMYALKEHVIAKHSRIERFHCSYCPKSFVRPSYMRRHESLIHKKKTVVRKYSPCPVCEKSINAYFIKIHIATVHEKFRPFKCGECTRGFLDRKSLAEHKGAMHSSEKYPYECVPCGWSTAYSSNYKRHVKSNLHKKRSENYAEEQEKKTKKKQNH